MARGRGVFEFCLQTLSFFVYWRYARYWLGFRGGCELLLLSFISFIRSLLGLHCLFFSLPLFLTDISYFGPLGAGTRQSLFGEVSALADMSAFKSERACNRGAAGGGWPAARLVSNRLFGDLGALTSCAWSAARFLPPKLEKTSPGVACRCTAFVRGASRRCQPRLWRS